MANPHMQSPNNLGYQQHQQHQQHQMQPQPMHSPALMSGHTSPASMNGDVVSGEQYRYALANFVCALSHTDSVHLHLSCHHSELHTKKLRVSDSNSRSRNDRLPCLGNGSLFWRAVMIRANGRSLARRLEALRSTIFQLRWDLDTCTLYVA